MDPDLLLDDLPAEARTLIDEAERELIEMRDRAERQADAIRARADRAVAEISAKSNEEVRLRQRRLLEQLKPLQTACVREGKLDEALSIRDQIRALKAVLLHAQPDPGSLANLPDHSPGTQTLFEVIGSRDGTVWGTDVYTSDSALAAAAVHAGAVRDGERSIVRVTYVEALNVAFTGSQRNGVWSESFGPWPIGFRVERA